MSWLPLTIIATWPGELNVPPSPWPALKVRSPSCTWFKGTERFCSADHCSCADRDTLLAFVRATIAAGAIVHTDGWSGYGKLAGAGYDHRPVNQHYRLADRTLILPRAHRAISNLKTWIAGTHHGTSAKHLQVYLDEFTFRHNRRHTPHGRLPDSAGPGHTAWTLHLPAHHNLRKPDNHEHIYGNDVVTSGL